MIGAQVLLCANSNFCTVAVSYFAKSTSDPYTAFKGSAFTDCVVLHPVEISATNATPIAKTPMFLFITQYTTHVWRSRHP